MKKKILLIALIASTAQANASTRLCGWGIKTLPPGNGVPTQPTQPSGPLDEGTDEGLNLQDRARLSDWALNTKLGLEEILMNIEPLKMVEKKRMLVECIENVVIDSAPLSSETLLRYTLTRALKANEVIEEEGLRKNLPFVAAGTIDQQVRLLRESVKMALDYYKNDVAYINGKNTKLRDLIAPEYAAFGARYNDLILKLSSSLFDATAQYGILRKSIGWFAKDLSKDVKAEAFGRIAINLDNSYRTLPDPTAYVLDDTSAVIHGRKAKRSLLQAKTALDSVKTALGI